MSQKHNLTWHQLVALEHGGHDKFLPSLSNPELRFMMASIREHFASQPEAPDFTIAVGGRDGSRTAPEAPSCCPFMRSGGFHGEDCADQGRGQCAQPKAPKATAAEEPAMTCTECGETIGDSRHFCFDDAPKAPAAKAEPTLAGEALLLRDLAAANAALKAEVDAHGNTLRLLAAANARIAELEDRLNLSNMNYDSANGRASAAVIELQAANARADAAERNLREQVALGDAWRNGQAKAENRCHELAQKLDAAERESLEAHTLMAEAHCARKRAETERDQLAARVTELQADQELARDVEYMHSLNANQCTPEERQVLEVMGKMERPDVRWKSAHATCAKLHDLNHMQAKQIETLKSQYDTAFRERAEAESQVRKLQSDLTVCSEQTETRAKRCYELEQERIALCEANKVLAERVRVVEHGIRVAYNGGAYGD